MKPINTRDFDTSVRPQDDFYRYVNGGWFKRNTIPPTENRWGSFVTLHHKNRKILQTLLEDLSKKKSLKKESDARKLRDLFLSSMNMKRRNQEGLSHLKRELDVIESVKNKKELTSLFAYMHKRGVDAPWALWIDQDDKNSRRMVLRIGQGGLGVPDRNYHVKKDKESKRIQHAYKDYIKKMLYLEGRYSKKEISDVMKTILHMEVKLARASMTPVECRDVHALYNKRNVKGLQKACPLVSWKEYFDLLGVPKAAWPHIIVNQPKFLHEVNTLLRVISLEDWKVYLRWHFLDTYAGVLGEDFIKVRFAYHGKVVQGLQKIPELWKRSVGIADALMGDALGQLYVKKYFPSRAKRAIEKLVDNLIKACHIRIRELDWMGETTKQKALRKLNTISLQLGYPKKWRSYKALKITRDSFAKNVIEGTLFLFKEEMKKLAKPTNPNDWTISAPTVNAFFSFTLNQIIFPAGILQPPFFYPDADEAVNYGAIGAVIGHELTHGFDDQGALYDEKGNLKRWWSKEDKKRFDARARVLVRQFNAYEIVDGINVNGKLTLGENIADLGGLVIAYKAFKIATKNKKLKKIDGLTPEERFFVSHALSERTLVRDEFLKLATLTDPHAPHEFRSNGPVSNVDEFYEVFALKEKDKLYRRPKARAHIW